MHKNINEIAYTVLVKSKWINGQIFMQHISIPSGSLSENRYIHFKVYVYIQVCNVRL